MKRGLFLKYVALFVGLVAVVGVINAALDLYFVYRDNRQASINVQREKAVAAAQTIESFVKEIERQIGWVAYAQFDALPAEQRRFDYVRLLRQVPAITELAQLDRTGHEQLHVSRLSMDVIGSNADRSNDPAFIEAKAHKVYYGPVYFRKGSEPYLTMAVAHGGRGGVTVADVNLKLIWDVVSQIRIGQNGYAYVIDRQGRLVAHPDISLVLRGTDMSKLAQVEEVLKHRPATPGATTRSMRATATACRCCRPMPSSIAELDRVRRAADGEAQQPVIDARPARPRPAGAGPADRRRRGGAAGTAHGGADPRHAGERRSASAAAISATACRSRPATSWRRWPTSSTARPRPCRSRTRPWSSGSRIVPPSCASRWTSRPRPLKSCA